MLNRFRTAALGLQDSRASALLWPVLSLRRTFHRGRLSLAYQDRDGDWIDQSGGSKFHSPLLDPISAEETKRDVENYWLYEFNLRPGDTVVDVGAGIGNETLIFSRLVGPSGRVIAIEAHPRTFRCLKKTVEANRLKNVTPVHAAISDASGVLLISNDGHHIESRVGVSEGLSVEATTLDKLLAECGAQAPNLVKMNIEGAETAALRGAPQTLKRAKRWVVSCHDFVGLRTYSDVVEIFKEAGLSPKPPRSAELGAPVPYYVYVDRS